jgi:hypothetical protein
MVRKNIFKSLIDRGSNSFFKGLIFICGYSLSQTCSKQWRQWLAGLRQGIEGVFDKLLNTFRLAKERPHALTGFQARLAAKISLHNFCIWLTCLAEVAVVVAVVGTTLEEKKQPQAASRAT